MGKSITYIHLSIYLSIYINIYNPMIKKIKINYFSENIYIKF